MEDGDPKNGSGHFSLLQKSMKVPAVSGLEEEERGSGRNLEFGTLKELPSRRVEPERCASLSATMSIGKTTYLPTYLTPFKSP